MIKTDDAFQGMVLKGVGPEFDATFFRDNLLEGEIPAFSDSAATGQVVISKALVDKLKLKLGDKIFTYYIQDNVRVRPLTVTGIYQTNFSEYDNLFLLTDLYTVNRLNNWKPDQVSGAELQVKDYDRLPDITYEVAESTDNRADKYGGVYFVQNIEESNPQIFAPKAFRIPIMLVRSIIIISKPEIMVKPATPIIRIKITHTFRSSKPSHSNI